MEEVGFVSSITPSVHSKGLSMSRCLRSLHISSCFAIAAVVLSSCFAASAWAKNPKLDDIFEKGLHFLANNQNDKGQISPRIGSGVTALAVTAGLRHGVELDEPHMVKALKALEG